MKKHFSKIAFSQQIRRECHLPTEGPLQVTDLDILCKHPEFEEHPIVVFGRKNNFSALHGAKVKAPGKPLHLFYTPNHFDVIKSVSALLDKTSGFYCHKCNKYDTGLEAVDDFAKSLFSQDGELFRATLGKHQFARIFAHNGSCFDYFPFVDKIGRYTGKDPDVIFDGSSIICIKVFDKRLIFMDSFWFLPMRLADMPTTFGVSDVAKGFFLYRLNTPELWDECIPKPEIEDFEPDFMSVSKQSEFLEWYRSAIEEPYMQ